MKKLVCMECGREWITDQYKVNPGKYICEKCYRRIFLKEDVNAKSCVQNNNK